MVNCVMTKFIGLKRCVFEQDYCMVCNVGSVIGLVAGVC